MKTNPKPTVLDATIRQALVCAECNAPALLGSDLCADHEAQSSVAWLRVLGVGAYLRARYYDGGGPGGE